MAVLMPVLTTQPACHKGLASGRFAAGHVIWGRAGSLPTHLHQRLLLQRCAALRPYVYAWHSAALLLHAPHMHVRPEHDGMHGPCSMGIIKMGAWY